MVEKKANARRKSDPLVSPTLSLDKKKKAMGKKKGRKEGRKKGSGPHIPSSLRKEIDLLNPNPKSPEHESGSDGEEGDVREDVYEYEEPLPQEESKKNRRFDSVENYEYELPEEFEDEDVPSDDEEDEGIPSDKSDEEEEGDRHLRMLQGITGMPTEAFDVKEKKKKTVLSDFQGDVGDGQISVHDLLDPLHDKPGYSKLRRRLDHLEKKQMPLQAPLPKVEREKLERKVAYEHSKKDVTKWEPLVKRNREAPTLYFDEDVNLGFSTIGAIASEFEPRTEFEKKMALLVQDPEVMEAHKKDGSRLLELNKISVEDVKDRQNRLAKMRSLLFRHEMKAKHIKKIKSKTYHRILKKGKLKAASAEMQMDPEAAKDYAMKQEFKRAEERMTLKHKNNSKWAKRILQRGLKVQDEGTRAAIAEQLHKHELLTRKVNSMKDTSSSDDSSDEDSEELSPRTDGERASKLLNRAKEKTAVVMEEDEIPKSGVFALPFMVGLKNLCECHQVIA
ncbi:putative U3 small nucleolar RNA-associated protein 14 [Cocos nucifera]|uniref:Putative U3 small nucleolar RNA-associated protein 14 n=1 Tax=Cocos nucifera TaxID=13894 RepID=A0A8K0N045_COCNU|nr:putative U3 small nucleolar RNA-associated protein 14 [Cocos nucifera]